MDSNSQHRLPTSIIMAFVLQTSIMTLGIHSKINT
jgi:hypothetical protein